MDADRRFSQPQPCLIHVSYYLFLLLVGPGVRPKVPCCQSGCWTEGWELSVRVLDRGKLPEIIPHLWKC